MVGRFYSLPKAGSAGARAADEYLAALWTVIAGDTAMSNMSGDELAEMYKRMADAAAQIGAAALSPVSEKGLQGAALIRAQEAVDEGSRVVLEEMLARGADMRPPLSEVVDLVYERHPRFEDLSFLEASGFNFPDLPGNVAADGGYLPAAA